MPAKQAKNTKRSPAQEKRDQYTVVLEEIREQYKALAEGARFDRQQQAKVNKKLAKLDKLSDDVGAIKTELKIMRQELISHAKFNHLEKRVGKTEQKVATR